MPSLSLSEEGATTILLRSRIENDYYSKRENSLQNRNMNKILGIIYKITNDVNEKIYIGQTIKTVKKRWQQHICNSSKEYFSQIVLYKAMNKYGIEHFKIEEIEEVENEFLDEREKYWIKYYDSYNHGYNSTIGGRETALYDLDEQQVINDYYQLKTARKVALKYGVDHNTIDNILNKNNVERFSQRKYNGQKIRASKENVILHFDSIVDCAEYLIQHNITQSKKLQTVKQWVSDVANGRRELYYGWYFCKE